jgi:hypothetical protein
MVLILMGPLSTRLSEAADNYRRLRRSASGSIFHMARTYAVHQGMSDPKADMCRALADVRFVPIADIRRPNHYSV